MLLHTITFDRLESDYEELGDIRSIEVDHSRRRIILVCDEIKEKTNEGATVRSGVDLNSRYDEVPESAAWKPIAREELSNLAGIPGFEFMVRSVE